MIKSISVPLHRILSPPYKWWELYISCSRLTFSVTVRQIASPGRHPWSLFPIYNSQSIAGRCVRLCGTYLRVRVGILSRLSQRAPWSLCLINAAVTHQKLDFSLSPHGRPFGRALCEVPAAYYLDYSWIHLTTDPHSPTGIGFPAFHQLRPNSGTFLLNFLSGGEDEVEMAK